MQRGIIAVRAREPVAACACEHAEQVLTARDVGVRRCLVGGSFLWSEVGGDSIGLTRRDREAWHLGGQARSNIMRREHELAQPRPPESIRDGERWGPAQTRDPRAPSFEDRALDVHGPGVDLLMTR